MRKTISYCKNNILRRNYLEEKCHLTVLVTSWCASILRTEFQLFTVRKKEFLVTAKICCEVAHCKYFKVL